MAASAAKDNAGNHASRPGQTLSRVFDAPRDLMFSVWTEPDHVRAWWGPKGFTNPRCDWDARAGGDIYIEMQGPDGTRYPMKGAFREVKRPERLVFTAIALDEKGEPALEVLTTVTFEEQGSKTKVTVVLHVASATSVGEGFLEGMIEGWNQQLDRLAEHVRAV
jgi:uncharacterized protein YndB with AHSA1/START domain